MTEQEKRKDMRCKLGNFGESVAAARLARQGYHVVARKWRCRAGEIDLIVTKDDELIFVEVRTFRSTNYGTPEESITPKKQARLLNVAYTYLESHDVSDDIAWRIDLVAITIDRSGRVASLNHIPGVVEE